MSARRVHIPTKNPAMREALRIADRVARTKATVLILGETGTGKDLIARRIHQVSGLGGPFVPINCGAVHKDMFRSELYGHVRGAFTGATEDRRGLFRHASLGTAFLDEIGDLPLDDQVKFNRFLETRKVRPLGSDESVKVATRIVTATNRDLRKLVKAEQFRRDLYYRLNVISLEIPPLRDRHEDFDELVKFVTNKLRIDLTLKARDLSEGTIRILRDYAWPGNIRELENVVSRLLLLFPKGTATPLEVLNQLDEVAVERPRVSAEELSELGSCTLWELEELHIRNMLRKNKGNRAKTARQLGIHYKTLYNRLNGKGRNNGCLHLMKGQRTERSLNASKN